MRTTPSSETIVEGTRGQAAWLRYLAAALALIALVGCGPLLSTAEITAANDAVESAIEVDAEQYATYEFVSAQEYLEKAREEWAYSDYQKALEYAERALLFAEQAYERAVNNPNRGAPDIEDVF